MHDSTTPTTTAKAIIAARNTPQSSSSDPSATGTTSWTRMAPMAKSLIDAP